MQIDGFLLTFDYIYGNISIYTILLLHTKIIGGEKMQEQKLNLIHSFLKNIMRVTDKKELSSLAERYANELELDPQQPDVIYKLWQDASKLGRELVSLRSGGDSNGRFIETLSEQEKAVLAEVERVIRENLLEYHFQPIVSAVDGDIYSYEALMRPKSDMELTPYHIIKYSYLTGRLDDIERATFLNVLSLIDNSKDKFHGRRVFINSIPNTKLYGDDLKRANELLREHSDIAVVEMTEQTELDEYELSVVKERFRSMNVQIAIDDYGTGYSNVKNLLMYTPNFVKIDRSLLSNIQDSSKKRHFVREIVEFCHDNGILALAEGVETSEELRTVILLGADLVQGFYTARPAAQPLESIPYEIRQEIKRYQQERQDGKDQQLYTANSTERIQLDRLVKEGYQCILIGKEADKEGDVTVVGWPTMETDMHIEISKGFKGTVTLENVRLSNVKNRPSIDISEDCDVTLFLIGENRLDKNGICVPEGARLTVQGEGSLYIPLEGADSFGIGNDNASTHGELVFEQQGCVQIDANSKTVIGIGSGLGGKIFIRGGKFILNIDGESGVAIGALYADTRLEVSSCDMQIDMSMARGAAIGSLTCNADVSLYKSFVRIHMGGSEMSSIGTVGGDSGKVYINDANVVINITAERCTCAGALDGSTDFKVDKAGFKATANGRRVLPFGGFTGDTRADLIDANTAVKIKTETDFRDYLQEENFVISDGTATFELNNYEVEANARMITTH